jgi:peptide/nickel transport system permease protein
VLPFILKRLSWAAVLLLAISLVTFVIFFVLPAQPINRGQIGTTDIAIRDAYEFTGSIWHEYWQFVRNIVVDQDLGQTLSTRDPVVDRLVQAAPVTAWLVLGGLVLMISIALPIGILSAVRPRTLLDRGTMLFVLLGVSAHPAWIGLILAYFLGFKWQVLPVAGYCDLVNPSTDCGGPLQWTTHMLLPWFTFSVIFAAMYTRMIRASVLETMREDYVRTARAKGVPEREVLRGHVLRNALMPVVTMLSLDAAGMAGLGLTGVIFVERVFGLPGLGGLMLEGLNRRDPPIVLGVVIFFSTTIVLFNLVVDIAYTFLDPRVRTSEASGGFRLPRRRPRPAAEPGPVGVEPAYAASQDAQARS